MLLRYEWVGTWEVVDYRWVDYRWVDFWEVVGPSGLEVVSYGYSPWEEYRGEEGEYIWTGGEWERIGEVRKRTDVPLQKSLDDRSRKQHTKGHLLIMMPYCDMMWSSRVAVCFGMFAKELMWPDMVIPLIDTGSFSPPALKFRPTAQHILFDYLCFTTSNILSLLARALDWLSAPLNMSNVHGNCALVVKYAPSRLMVL
jgi:hypothetical protein